MDEAGAVAAEAGALLHGLRLRGTVPVPGGGAAIDSLVAEGWARRTDDRLVLTPDGRRSAEVRARLEARSDAEADAERAYAAFLPLNAEVIRACHDWQLTGEWKVVDRLGALDDRAGPIVRRLGARVDRFAEYRDRLRAARRRVEDGETGWFTSPRCDSYHTVWMQLHEDLLLALGLERTTES